MSTLKTFFCLIFFSTEQTIIRLGIREKQKRFNMFFVFNLLHLLLRLHLGISHLPKTGCLHLRRLPPWKAPAAEVWSGGGTRGGSLGWEQLGELGALVGTQTLLGWLAGWLVGWSLRRRGSGPWNKSNRSLRWSFGAGDVPGGGKNLAGNDLSGLVT